MFTNAKLALCVAAVLGSTSAAQTAPQHSAVHRAGSIIQYQPLTLKIQEIPEISVGTETQIVVEAQTIFDVSPGVMQMSL
jgi:hypothetical protein